MDIQEQEILVVKEQISVKLLVVLKLKLFLIGLWEIQVVKKQSV